jgi:hypothetical protein
MHLTILWHVQMPAVLLQLLQWSQQQLIIVEQLQYIFYQMIPRLLVVADIIVFVHGILQMPVITTV